jgi:hypothetical protein
LTPPPELPNIDPCGDNSDCQKQDIAQSIQLAAPDLAWLAWHNQPCRAALQVTKKDMAGVRAAFDSWPTLQAVGSSQGVPASILGAIGVRESNFAGGNEKDGAGVGVGVFQLTVSPKSGVTASWANGLLTASNTAAGMLNANGATLQARFPNLTASQLAQATAASYNIGTDPHKGITGNPNTIDQGTAGGNYGINVINIQSACFVF